MLIYQMFFRKYGIRRKEQLLSPIFTSFSVLSLPLKSLLHYVPDVSDQVGPLPTYPLLNDDWRYVYVGHVQELTAFEGSPRFIPVNFLGKIRDYQHANAKLIWLKKDPSIVIDPKSLVVMTYGGLEANYLYKREIISAQYRWRNDFATIYSKVNEQAVTGFRQQFLTIEMPDAIPSRSKFELAEREQTVQQMKNFKSSSLKFLLDFWIWLGNSREKSVLSKLNKEGLAHLNLILKSGDRAVILNLGMVNSWRKDINAEEGDIQGLKPEQIQRLFLRMVIDIIAPDLSISSSADGIAKQELKTLTKSRFDKPEDDLEPEEEPEAEAIDFAQVDDALKLHDEIADAADVADDITIADGSAVTVPEVVQPYVPPKDSLTQPILTRAREAVENGSISLAEMQRFQKLATTYETIPNPFGEGTLKDLIDIKDSDIRIDKHTPIVDIPTVLDKSMLKSTLIDFDPRYIKTMLHKDVGAFLMGIQKAGYAVTGLTVTEVEDVMNHFNRYTVNVVPVSGKPSTFNMEIPVIDGEGVVLAGGVKYYLKKQHGEKPIRKTAPHRVSLTSYFGKVFVDRSENVVNNYGLWLTNQIRSIGLDKEDTRITELRLSTNFNHRIILPRVYTLLSQSFGSFTIDASTLEFKSVIELSFDYENRKNILGADKLAIAEVDGNLLVGKKDGQIAVVLTPDGIFKTHPINQRMLPVVLGTIENLLSLPTEKAPLEVAVLNLFGKSLPLGFILAYRLGFPVLLATLGINYRRVPAGKQMGLQPDEYRLKFKDESWIFSRKDRVATLLLNGFNVFHRSIANYPAATFAKKDVYINIVEDSGLGSRYVKELDLMFDLFIDHITKDLLIEMKEPTDMFNLLIRATQLLLIDYYPDDGDKRFMRIKGYERIAGAVYTELVKSARYKLNNPSIVKSSLEVNPQAVKLAILTDSSKEIVEEINPIHNLKMAETVTFGGTGGRSTKTMVKSTRAYHDTDQGVISEATVDSGNVGIISYLSADPNFTSLRGTTRRFDLEEDGLSSLLSTSALLSPGAENDDYLTRLNCNEVNALSYSYFC
jgi:hypothetical protein